MNEQIYYVPDGRLGSGDRVNSKKPEYSKGALGRLKSTFNSTQLVFVGGQYDGEKGRASHFIPCIPQMPLDENTPIVEVAAFNVALPRVADILMFGGPEGKEGYLEGLGGYDLNTIPQIAVEMSQKGREYKGAVIRIVTGATTTMPLRALSYMLPALILMERLQQGGDPVPQLQFISAHHISGQLNHLNIADVRKQAYTFAHVARDYIEEFFPTLKESVVFLEDNPLDKGSHIRNEMLRVASCVRRDLPHDIAEILKAKGENNSNQRVVSFYAAAHLLVHDRHMTDSILPLLEDSPPIIDPDVIINIGGKQEELFYRLRHVVKPLVGEEYNTIQTLQYFTRHHVPPYYMAKGGDISLESALHGGFSGSVADVAEYDLKYLEKVSYFRGSLQEFIEKQRSKYMYE